MMRDTSLMITPQLSAEQMGAYMEGTLPPEEQMQVQTLIEGDPELSELYTDITTTPIDWSADIYEDYPDFDLSFQLPVIGEAHEASNMDADFISEDVYGSFPEEAANDIEEEDSANLPVDESDVEPVADVLDYENFDDDIATAESFDNDSSDNFNDSVTFMEGY